MSPARARLDRYISAHLGMNRGKVKALLAQGRVLLNGQPASDVQQLVDVFDAVRVDGRLLQERRPAYLMLHKPVGVVSATRDAQHVTALDLVAWPEPLHIAGRLDLKSSGLLLLTNDGRWSRGLSAPSANLPKLYEVELRDPLDERYAPAFAAGMAFPYEGIVTRPARLEILAPRVAQVWLTEGRYHQIKRMFGRFRNPVLRLQRLAVGELWLDPALAPGEWRELREEEVALLRPLPSTSAASERDGRQQA